MFVSEHSPKAINNATLGFKKINNNNNKDITKIFGVQCVSSIRKWISSRVDHSAGQLILKKQEWLKIKC